MKTKALEGAALITLTMITVFVIVKPILDYMNGEIVTLSDLMYELKTKENDNSVLAFIEQVENPKKREDAYRLLDIFTETTCYPAKMWGSSLLGFGAYHYKYESDHEGNAPLVAFSPRKANFSLYFAPGDREREELLVSFGKHKAGKGCVYINKIADIDENVLKQLIKQSVEFLNRRYGTL